MCIKFVGKSTLSRLLAKKINAVNLKSPPSCISSELRAAFDDSADLKTAFYALGNYIAAFEIAKTLETQPVVLDRFWNSTAANALARNVQAKPGGYDLPARGNPVYRWPADLIQPDVVLFLSVSEHERQRRQARRKEVTKEEMMLKEIHSFRQKLVFEHIYVIVMKFGSLIKFLLAIWLNTGVSMMKAWFVDQLKLI